MAKKKEVPNGYPMLRHLLVETIKISEEASVRYGTSYAEQEQIWVKTLGDAARVYGGDVCDPQWYAGAATVLTLMSAAQANHPLTALLGGDPVIPVLSAAMARLHDDIVRNLQEEVIPNG